MIEKYQPVSLNKHKMKNTVWLVIYTLRVRYVLMFDICSIGYVCFFFFSFFLVFFFCAVVANKEIYINKDTQCGRNEEMSKLTRDSEKTGKLSFMSRMTIHSDALTVLSGIAGT